MIKRILLLVTVTDLAHSLSAFMIAPRLKLAARFLSLKSRKANVEDVLASPQFPPEWPFTDADLEIDSPVKKTVRSAKPFACTPPFTPDWDTIPIAVRPGIITNSNITDLATNSQKRKRIQQYIKRAQTEWFWVRGSKTIPGANTFLRPRV